MNEHLCLDHFLDEASYRTDQTSRNCQAGKTISSTELELILADALVIVENLESNSGTNEPDTVQRDRMLELLLMLANLHEHAARYSVRADRLA